MTHGELRREIGALLSTELKSGRVEIKRLAALAIAAHPELAEEAVLHEVQYAVKAYDQVPLRPVTPEAMAGLSPEQRRRASANLERAAADLSKEADELRELAKRGPARH